MHRLAHLDRLRGFVVMLMALDHVRYFYGHPGFNPLDISQTNLFWFLTRWITHFCAPVFVFLAGVGISLTNRPIREQSFFLLTRGFWLIVIEFLWINMIWKEENKLFLQVFWALGVSMIFMAGVIYLPRKITALTSLFAIFSHNLLGKHEGAMWNLLHQPGELFGPFFVIYPLLPWVPVMALGFAVGPELSKLKAKALIQIGSAITLLFIFIRASNFYGDSTPWVFEATTSQTLMSFLNCQKYPPSLLYLLMTLGPACMLLGPFQQIDGIFANILTVLGRNPLFFYIIHVPIIASAAALRSGKNPASGPHIYLVWLAILGLCIMICKSFDAYKQQHRKDKFWLQYL